MFTGAPRTAGLPEKNTYKNLRGGKEGRRKQSSIRQMLPEKGEERVKNNNNKETGAGVLKMSDSASQKLSPEETRKAINIIFINCGWDPEKVLENKEEILELIPETEFRNKGDASAKKAKADRDFEVAVKNYGEEMKKIKKMSENVFTADKNSSKIKDAREIACKEAVKIMTAEKISHAAEVYLEEDLEEVG